ncbi:MAG TPA: tetratricopeptide repeat protein [Pirellulales bacterium]|nr:tetratricopeptide repeat protein [Pirellulales bacterium]
MTSVDPHLRPFASEGSPGAPRQRSKWLLAAGGTALICAAVWGVYARVIDAPFIYDDYTTLADNPSVRELWPLWKTSGEVSPLRPSVDTPVSARPLVNLTFAINYHFSHLSPSGYRLTNVAIHIAAALFLWALVRRTLLLDFFAHRYDGVAGALGFLAALIWAVHPLNTESVAYITQRTESQMGLCYLATMYACVRYWTATGRGARVGWLMAAAIACQLGALSKEIMATLPAVALLFERTFVAASFGRALRRSWPLYVGLALGWIPQVVINYHGPRTPSAGFHLGLPALVWWYTQTEVLLLYLKLAFWPWPLVLHYEIPYKETLAVAWPWVLPVALSALATIYLVWRRTSAGFVATTVVAALSPTLLVPCVGEIVAERRMYVSLAALVPFVVAGSYDIVRRLLQRLPGDATTATADRYSLGVMAWSWDAVALAFIAVANMRLVSYANQVTLLAETVERQPDDLSMLINLGVALSRAGRPEEALPHFERAADLYQNSPLLNYKLNHEAHKLYYNWALACQDLERPDEAIHHYEEAINVLGDHAQSHYNLGLLLQQRGLLAAALAQYKEALRINPAFAAANCNLGALLATAGQFEEAIPYLENGSRLDPEPGTFINLVDAYSQVGRKDDAIVAARTAIRLARERNRQELADQIEEWLTTFSPAGQKAE